MITPTEIRKKAENKYHNYLCSVVEGMSFEPIIIMGNKKPNDNTTIFEKEIIDLINCSKEKKGYGYSIGYQKVKTKLHGEQDLPSSISFLTEHDYLKFIGKENETIGFKNDIEIILCVFPILKEWICRFPNKVLNNHDVWEDLLKVCIYFKDKPTPNMYIRELPIKVHTKFIERNKGILKELLDIIIAEYINIDKNNFESRFNLRYDEPQVRFRILDVSINQEYLSGLSDLSIPISDFRLMSLPIKNVYVVENKMNMLTFPKKKDSIVIWGHGFGIEIMKNIDWLQNKNIYYWGDLDAQGFQILSEIRTYYKQVQSFLMDRYTFDNFFEGDKGTVTNVEKELCLTKEEKEIFDYLKTNNLRLEQEKIPFEYVLKNIP